MSPEAGSMLLNEVAPRIKAVTAHFKFVGSDDQEEVAQDTVAMAARMLHNTEVNRKKVTPGNIAYYALQHAKSGRRSVGYSNADALATATQLNGRSRVKSLEHPISLADETHEEFAFEELFESEQEDPSQLAARKLDWEAFLARQTDKARAIIQCMAEGKSLKSLADRFRLSDAGIGYYKAQLAQAIKEFMGEDVLTMIVKEPNWKSGLRAMREKQVQSC